MVRSSVKTITYSSGSRKYARSRQLVAKAAQLIRARMAGPPRAPLRTGGFYGVSTYRGRTELKAVDTNTSLSAIAGNGSLQLINGIATGTDYTDRTGRKIILKSLLARIFIYPTLTTSSSYGVVTRCLIIYDSQANGANPATTDILNVATYDAPMNLNNRDRFKILYDKYVTTPSFVNTASALTVGSPTPRIFKIFKKMNLEQIFGGTGSTIGSIQTGSIFVLLINSEDQKTSADAYFRVRFVDS